MDDEIQNIDTSVRPAVMVIIVAMIIATMAIIGVTYGGFGHRTEVASDPLSSVKEDKVIEIAPANFARQSYVDKICVNPANLVSNNIVIEKPATFVMISSSNRPGLVTEKQVLDAQNATRVQQAINSIK